MARRSRVRPLVRVDSPPDTESRSPGVGSFSEVDLIEAQVERSFDRFNFAIHKEKEMADFRKVLVLAGLVLMLALTASAQSQPEVGS